VLKGRSTERGAGKKVERRETGSNAWGRQRGSLLSKHYDERTAQAEEKRDVLRGGAQKSRGGVKKRSGAPSATQEKSGEIENDAEDEHGKSDNKGPVALLVGPEEK